MKKRSVRCAGFIMAALSIALCAGVKLVFHACGPVCMDGTAGYMNCHNAETAVCAVGAGMALLSAAALATENRLLKILLSALVGLGGIAAAVIPNNVIKLCMMEDMHCHAVMRPAVIIIGALAAVSAVVHIILVKTGE